MGGDNSTHSDGEVEQTSLSTSVNNLLEEARIILPGAQTLFGFQLIVVFNQSFRDLLSTVEQYLHLTATALTVMAIALLMAPAAYHRQAEPSSVSHRFLRLATLQLTWGTVPLAAALCLDFYLVAQLISGSRRASLFLSLMLVTVIGTLWYLLPHLTRHENGR